MQNLKKFLYSAITCTILLNVNLSRKLSKLIIKKILSNDLIKSFALPKKIHGTMFSKSKSGMKYGRHIDNAYMSSGRADLSFTIFLNCKEDYKGGEYRLRV